MTKNNGKRKAPKGGGSAKINDMTRKELENYIKYIFPKINQKQKQMYDKNNEVGEMYKNRMQKLGALKINGKSLDGNLGTFSRNLSDVNKYLLSAKQKELNKLTTNQLRRLARETQKLYTDKQIGTPLKAMKYIDDTRNKSWRTLMDYLDGTGINESDIISMKKEIMETFYNKMSSKEYSSDGAFFEAINEVVGNNTLTLEIKNNLLASINESKKNKEKLEWYKQFNEGDWN